MFTTQWRELKPVVTYFKNSKRALVTEKDGRSGNRLHLHYVINLISKFLETGSSANKIDAIGDMLAATSRISHRSLQSILKYPRFNPCKIHLVQKFSENNPKP